MKKKWFFKTVCFVILIIAILTVPTFAEEEEAGGLSDVVLESPVEEEAVGEEQSDTNETDEFASTGAAQSIFTRLWEFFDQHKDFIVDIIGFVSLIAMLFYEGRVRKKSGIGLTGSLSKLFAGTAAVSESQNSVVSAANDMLAGYEKVCESNKELRLEVESVRKAGEGRDKLVGALAVQMSAVLEILMSVYANSKNLPQGVKDIVSLRYAKCLSATESDEGLRDCIESIRKTIGAGEREESKEA